MNQKQINGNRGFSFVEAMVVAVIVGILAAVAIPMYNGFIKDQRVSTVNNLAETAAASANAYVRRTGICNTSVSVLGLYYNPAQYNISITCGGNYVTVQDVRHPAISANRNF